jgi:hypothetical protein
LSREVEGTWFDRLTTLSKFEGQRAQRSRN